MIYGYNKSTQSACNNYKASIYPIKIRKLKMNIFTLKNINKTQAHINAQ